MNIENTPQKKNEIDLEDSPFGDANLVKLQEIEPCISNISLDLFHCNSGKKDEKIDVLESIEGGLPELSCHLSEVIVELQDILKELQEISRSNILK